MSPIVISAVISTFKEKINAIVDNIGEELHQSLDKGLMQYVNNWYDKTSMVKTFIQKDQKVKFYDVYFPLSICSYKQNIDIPDHVTDLFSDSNYISILGYAGSGKTMLMKHCFLSCLSKQDKIPVIIELRKLNSYEGKLIDYIQEIMFSQKIASGSNVSKRLLESGEFMFFFDGYDELSLSSKENRTNEIERFVDTYYQNYYVMTSRPDAGAENFERFNNYRIQPLNNTQIRQFVEMQTRLLEDGDELREKMSKALDNADSNIIQYLMNPLLLSMFIATFNYHPMMPTRKSDFYFNVFDTLYTKHDSITKGGGYSHEKKSGLEKSQFIELLQWFCYRTYNKQQYLFSQQVLENEINDVCKGMKYNVSVEDIIYDLHVSMSLLVQDGTDYTFPHRSLQEYFVARKISKLPEETRKKVVYCSENFQRSNNENLWTLCQELDSFCFLRDFVLPHLEEIRVLIDKNVNVNEKTKKELLLYVIKSQEFTIFIENGRINSSSCRDTFNEGLLRYVNSNTQNFTVTLTSFFFDNSENIVQLLGTKAKYYTTFSSKNCRFDEKSNFELIYPYMEQQGLDDKIYECYMHLCGKINVIRSQIQEQQNQNNSLLNIELL